MSCLEPVLLAPATAAAAAAVAAFAVMVVMSVNGGHHCSRRGNQ